MTYTIKLAFYKLKREKKNVVAFNAKSLCATCRDIIEINLLYV